MSFHVHLRDIESTGGNGHGHPHSSLCVAGPGHNGVLETARGGGIDAALGESVGNTVAQRGVPKRLEALGLKLLVECSAPMIV